MIRQESGYIKLYRKFLTSNVRRLKPAAICVFIDLLLLAEYKTGEIKTSYRELAQTLVIRNLKAIQNALRALEQAGAIKTQRMPHLSIRICNWKRYQEPQKTVENLWKSVTPNVTPVTPNETPTVTPNVTNCYAKRNTHNNKVPVSIDVFKEKEFFIGENAKHLNFTNPKTDLEKLALFFAKGIKHPALKKPDANRLLNVALKNDLPHFETILAATDDLQQAQQIVARFVKNAKGHYSLYYLAQQVNSYRQELESENRRER